MTSRQLYSIASLALFLVSVSLFVYLFFNARGLEESVSELRAERDQLQSERDDLERERDQLKNEREQLFDESRLTYNDVFDLRRSIAGSEWYIEFVGGKLLESCKEEFKERCEYFVKLGDLMNLRNEIKLLSVEGVGENIEELSGKLDIFIEKNSQLHERFPDKWRSKDFNSFQAYALSDKANIALVRGRINEAETLIDQALELSSRSAAARMIDLKIRCTSRPGLAENRKLFDDTVSMLKNEIDDAKDEQGKKNARMMYIYFSEDYQLKKLCGFD